MARVSQAVKEQLVRDALGIRLRVGIRIASTADLRRSIRRAGGPRLSSDQLNSLGRSLGDDGLRLDPDSDETIYYGSGQWTVASTKMSAPSRTDEEIADRLESVEAWLRTGDDTSDLRAYMRGWVVGWRRGAGQLGLWASADARDQARNDLAQDLCLWPSDGRDRHKDVDRLLALGGWPP